MKTITSTSHELVKHWVRLQRDRSYRHTLRTVLVEGKNLLKDLMKRHTPLRFIVTSEQRDSMATFSGEMILITPEIASKISAVENSEGCFAEYAIPSSKMPAHVEQGLILDGLQDPGNVGTLLRTALALDVRTIFLIEPCCDPWNPKTLRAAKGAHFDLSITSCTWERIHTNSPLFVADINGEDIHTIRPCRPWLLVLGNEAHGHRVPPSLHPRFVTIPMPGPVESLNVSQAGAILLYTLRAPIL
jgi:TrmH family RNA methyltransferase